MDRSPRQISSDHDNRDRPQGDETERTEPKTKEEGTGTWVEEKIAEVQTEQQHVEVATAIVAEPTVVEAQPSLEASSVTETVQKPPANTPDDLPGPPLSNSPLPATSGLPVLSPPPSYPPSIAHASQKKHREASHALAVEHDAANGSLAALWQSLLAEKYKGFHKPLTGKELGQRKNIHRVLRDQTPDTRAVIRWVFEKWDRFAWAVQARKGWTGHPEEPSVSWLAVHYDLAVNMITDEVAAKAKVVELSEPTVWIPMNSKPKEPPYVLTSEELSKLLDELK